MSLVEKSVWDVVFMVFDQGRQHDLAVPAGVSGVSVSPAHTDLSFEETAKRNHPQDHQEKE